MEPSRDERNVAALAQCLGIIVALPVWLRWRGRSAFVRAHTGLSMAFDGLAVVALVMVAALAIGVAVGGNAALSTLSGSGRDVALLFLVMVCAPGLALIGLVAVLIVMLVFRLRATVAATQGKPFRYPLLKRLGRF